MTATHFSMSTHTPQFSQEDVGRIFFPDVMLKLGNWITAGHVKPERVKDPVKGGPARLRYSVTEIYRIGVIDMLVNGIGIKPSQAAEVADFALPFLNDAFDRHLDGERVSEARMYVTSYLERDDGTMKSRIFYRKPDDGALYLEDPYRNPDAKPHAPPLHRVAIYLPLTDTFNKVFLTCTELLTIQKRGGMDK